MYFYVSFDIVFFALLITRTCLSQLVCPKGTTLQNSKCRILALHDCDLIRNYFSLPCVKYAKCVSYNSEPDAEKGFCKCDVETFGYGRSICPRPSTLNPGDEITDPPQYDYPGTDGTEPENPKHPVSRVPCPSSTTTETGELIDPGRTTKPGQTTKPRQTTKPGQTTKPKQPRRGGGGHHTHRNEMHEHLIEMAVHRGSVYGEHCNIKDNAKFREIAEYFSDANKFHRDISSDELNNLTGVLHYLRAKGNHFCDIQKHLMCSSLSSTCQCLHDLYPDSDNECRIPERRVCDPNATNWMPRNLATEFILPSPQCVQGSGCTSNSTSTVSKCTKGTGLSVRRSLKADHSSGCRIIFVTFSNALWFFLSRLTLPISF